MLFKITDKDFFYDNPEALSIPVFKKVGGISMKFIALVYGYNTPFRKLYIDERKRKAVKICGIKKTPKGRIGKLERILLGLNENKDKDLELAINEYLSIQFDEDRDTLEAHDKQIKDFKDIQRKQDKSSKEIDQCLKISKDMPGLLLIRKSLIDILEIRQEDFYKNEDSLDEESSDVEDFLDKLIS